jgi:hypothetical protein
VKKLILTVLTILLFAVPAAAQTTSSAAPNQLVELVLKDGSRFYGTIERESNGEVVVRTDAGALVTTRREDISSVRVVRRRSSDGELLPSDAHRTRLFFAPTGRSLRQGEVSIGVFQFLAPFVQVGVTDRVSVGGGTPLLFGFEDFERPFWLTPKVQVVDTSNVQGAVGLLHIFAPGEQGAGIAYGVATLGNSDNAFTGGAGMTYSGDARGWIVKGGGEGRIHRHVKVMTENYFWRDGNGIVSGGVRFLGERLSADLALAIPVGVGEFYAFPVVNFAYVF